MLKYFATIAVAGSTAWLGSASQSTQCDLNAPSEALMARRRSAISAARQINTAQARLWQTTSRYLPISELTGVTVPEGFDVQVSTDGETYTFSIKDVQDACRLAVFSDQKGVIYTAMPLR